MMLQEGFIKALDFMLKNIRKFGFYEFNNEVFVK